MQKNIQMMKKLLGAGFCAAILASCGCDATAANVDKSQLSSENIKMSNDTTRIAISEQENKETSSVENTQKKESHFIPEPEERKKDNVFIRTLKRIGNWILHILWKILCFLFWLISLPFRFLWWLITLIF